VDEQDAHGLPVSFAEAVIPAETPILTFPLAGGRDDCLLSRKRERIEVRAAGIQSIIKILRNAEQNLKSILNRIAGFPPARE
jgi:hypothetical protein